MMNINKNISSKGVLDNNKRTRQLKTPPEVSKEVIQGLSLYKSNDTVSIHQGVMTSRKSSSFADGPKETPCIALVTVDVDGKYRVVGISNKFIGRPVLHY